MNRVDLSTSLKGSLGGALDNQSAMNATAWSNYIQQEALLRQQAYLRDQQNAALNRPTGEWFYDVPRMMYTNSQGYSVPAENVKRKRSLSGRWYSRMLRLKEKDWERKLTFLRKIGWYVGLLWGSMVLVAVTAKLFEFTVWTALG